MKKYKIINCTMSHFQNIDLDIDEDSFVIGETMTILGVNVVITQNGGGVIAGSSPECVFVLQEVAKQ